MKSKKSRFKIILIILLLVAILAGVNFVYQVVRNPAALIGTFSSSLYKSSRSTWESYHRLFKRHSTRIMTPEFLAAMAQVESAGNPLVTPKWRWRLTLDITRIYAPASTSFGLYQYFYPSILISSILPTCILPTPIVAPISPLLSSHSGSA